MGESFSNITIKVAYNNGQKFDFTGATEISVRFRTGAKTITKLLSLNEVTNLSLGQLSVGLTSADTLAMLPVEDGSVRIRVTKPNETRVAVVNGLKVRR